MRSLAVLVALLGLLAATAIAVSPLDRLRTTPRPAAGPFPRFREGASAGVPHVTSYRQLIEHFVNTPNIAGWPDSHHVSILRALFSHPFPIVNAGDEVYRDYASIAETNAAAHAANNNDNFVGGDDAHSRAVRNWINHLRATFQPDPTLLQARSLLVRGGGPSGLATALAARLQAGGGQALATVHVHETRHSYTRKHMVNLVTDDATFGVANGGKFFLTQIGARFLKPYFNYIRVGQADDAADIAANTDIIATETLEKILLLTALTVGVEFKVVTGAPGANGFSKAQILAENAGLPAAWSAGITAATGHPGAAITWTTKTACTAIPPGDDRVPTPEEASAYDVIVGADGASSSFRTSSFIKPAGSDEAVKFTAASLQAANAHGRALDQAIVAEASAKPCPVFAYVLNSAICHDKVVDAGGVFRAGFSKPNVANTHYALNGRCMLEIPFVPKAGRLFSSALGDSCAWNFNVDSETRSSQNAVAGENNRLRLAFALFNEVWGAPAAGNRVSHFKDNVKEIKAYSVGLRVAHHPSKPDRVYVGRHVADAARPNGRVYVLVGDAAREAVPQAGMGANTGMDMGYRAAVLARTYTAGTVDGLITALEDTARTNALQFRDTAKGWWGIGNDGNIGHPDAFDDASTAAPTVVHGTLTLVTAASANQRLVRYA